MIPYCNMNCNTKKVEKTRLSAKKDDRVLFYSYLDIKKEGAVTPQLSTKKQIKVSVSMP